MAEVTELKALANYFNEGAAAVPLREFAKELKVLSPEEKRELALGVVAITGDTLKV